MESTITNSSIMLNPSNYVLINKEEDPNSIALQNHMINPNGNNIQILNYQPHLIQTPMTNVNAYINAQQMQSHVIGGGGGVAIANGVVGMPGRQLTDDDIRNELLKTLEYYFSSKNLAKDQYLVSQMDNEYYVSVSEIAKFNKIKNLTNDLELIKNIIRQSSQLQLDPQTQTKVRSINGVNGGLITVKSKLNANLIDTNSNNNNNNNNNNNINNINNNINTSINNTNTNNITDPTSPSNLSKQKCILILREVSPKATEDKLKELFTDKEPQCPMYLDCESAGNDSWYVSFSNEEQAQRALQYLKTEIQIFMDKPIRARIKHVIPRSSTANNTSAILNNSLNTTLNSTPASTPPPSATPGVQQQQTLTSPLVTAQPQQQTNLQNTVSQNQYIQQIPVLNQQIYTTPAQIYQQYQTSGSTSSPLSPNQYFIPVTANRYAQNQTNAYIIQNEPNLGASTVAPYTQDNTGLYPNWAQQQQQQQPPPPANAIPLVQLQQNQYWNRNVNIPTQITHQQQILPGYEANLANKTAQISLISSNLTSNPNPVNQPSGAQPINVATNSQNGNTTNNNISEDSKGNEQQQTNQADPLKSSSNSKLQDADTHNKQTKLGKSELDNEIESKVPNNQENANNEQTAQGQQLAISVNNLGSGVVLAGSNYNQYHSANLQNHLQSPLTSQQQQTTPGITPQNMIPIQFLNNNFNSQYKAYYSTLAATSGQQATVVNQTAGSPSIMNQPQQQGHQYQPIYSHIPHMNPNYQHNTIDPNQVISGAIITTNLGQYVASPNQHFVIQQAGAANSSSNNSNATNPNSNSSTSTSNQVQTAAGQSQIVTHLPADQLNGNIPITSYANSYIISASGNPNANPNIFNPYQYTYGNLNQTTTNLYQANTGVGQQHPTSNMHQNNQQNANNISSNAHYSQVQYNTHSKHHHNNHSHHQQQNYNPASATGSATTTTAPPPNSIPVSMLQGAGIYYDLMHSGTDSTTQPITIMVSAGNPAPPAGQQIIYKNQSNESLTTASQVQSIIGSNLNSSSDTNLNKNTAKTPIPAVPTANAPPPQQVQTIQVPISLPLLATTATTAAAGANSGPPSVQLNTQQQPALLFYNNGMQHQPILINQAVVAATTSTGQNPNSINLMPASAVQQTSATSSSPQQYALTSHSSHLLNQTSQTQVVQHTAPHHPHHHQNYHHNSHNNNANNNGTSYHHQQQQQSHHNSHHHHQSHNTQHQSNNHMQPPHRRNLGINNNSESRSSSGSNHYHQQNQRNYNNSNNSNYSGRSNKYHNNNNNNNNLNVSNNNNASSPSPSNITGNNVHPNYHNSNNNHYQYHHHHNNNNNQSQLQTQSLANHHHHHHHHNSQQAAQFTSIPNSIHSDSNTSSGISSTSNTPIHISGNNDNYDMIETNSTNSNRSSVLNKSPPINSDLASFPPLSSNNNSSVNNTKNKDTQPVNNNNSNQKQQNEPSTNNSSDLSGPIDPAIISISKSADSIPNSPTIIKSTNLNTNTNSSLANILTLAQQSSAQIGQDVANLHVENATNKSNTGSSISNRQHQQQQKNDYSRNANNNSNASRNNNSNYRSGYQNKRTNDSNYSASSSPSPTFSKHNLSRNNNNNGNNSNNRQTNANTQSNSNSLEQIKSHQVSQNDTNNKSQNETKQSSETTIQQGQTNNDIKMNEVSPLNKIPSTSSSSSSLLSTTLIAGSSSSSLVTSNQLNLNDLTLPVNSKTVNSTHSSTSSITSLQNEEDLVNSLNNCWNKKLTFAEVLQKPIQTPSSGGISVSTSSSSISEVKTKSNDLDGYDESNGNQDLDENTAKIIKQHQQNSPTAEKNIIMQMTSSNPSAVLAAD